VAALAGPAYPVTNPSGQDTQIPAGCARSAATHPAEPVHLWGAVRKDPHAALAQTEERRTRNA
jgi:hypothetical protein